MSDHFPEVVLLVVLALLLVVLLWMNHVHNDAIVSKVSDWIYANLGALWGMLTKRYMTTQGGPNADH